MEWEWPNNIQTCLGLPLPKSGSSPGTHGVRKGPTYPFFLVGVIWIAMTVALPKTKRGPFQKGFPGCGRPLKWQQLLFRVPSAYQLNWVQRFEILPIPSLECERMARPNTWSLEPDCSKIARKSSREQSQRTAKSETQAILVDGAVLLIQ